MRAKFATRLLPALAVAAVLGAGSWSMPAFALTDTANLTVSASVAAVCNVQAATLAFGAYDPAAADLDAITTVDVTCTPGTTYDVGLDGGGGADVANRQMANGGATLNYSMYRDAARTLNWGDTVGVDTVGGAGGGGVISHTVYGRIPTGQFVATGAYGDTVIITVTY
ncbi:MAG: spore coat U domain-containing protein [Rhodospirillales bacterium]|nr:spore coat U domain-containing protein [Rhodospirillales bacterium]MDH3916880.1 spore coat U domain-containing protein [Rhodospirillales bacterium]